jgi:hypothetical protein
MDAARRRGAEAKYGECGPFRLCRRKAAGVPSQNKAHAGGRQAVCSLCPAHCFVVERRHAGTKGRGSSAMQLLVWKSILKRGRLSLIADRHRHTLCANGLEGQACRPEWTQDKRWSASPHPMNESVYVYTRDGKGDQKDRRDARLRSQERQYKIITVEGEDRHRAARLQRRPRNHARTCCGLLTPATHSAASGCKETFTLQLEPATRR